MKTRFSTQKSCTLPQQFKDSICQDSLSWFVDPSFTKVKLKSRFGLKDSFMIIPEPDMIKDTACE